MTLREYIRKDSTCRRDNPGAPISYAVAFLKDNAIAVMKCTTSYKKTSSEVFQNGYVKFRHEAGYDAAFRVEWEERDANGNYRQAGPYNSGDTSMGWQEHVNLPGDARNIRLQAWAAVGIQTWHHGFDITLNSPDNKCYKVYGTVGEPSGNNYC